MGKAIQRLYTVKEGESSDTSSSIYVLPRFAPGPSIQSTTTYRYGANSGFFSGVDARTNTVTDARSNVDHTSIFLLHPV